MGKANVQDLGRSNQKKSYSTKKKLLNKTWCTVVTILCNLSIFRKVIFNFTLNFILKEGKHMWCFDAKETSKE